MLTHSHFRNKCPKAFCECSTKAKVLRHTYSDNLCSLTLILVSKKVTSALNFILVKLKLLQLNYEVVTKRSSYKFDLKTVLFLLWTRNIEILHIKSWSYTLSKLKNLYLQQQQVSFQTSNFWCTAFHYQPVCAIFFLWNTNRINNFCVSSGFLQRWFLRRFLNRNWAKKPKTAPVLNIRDLLNGNFSRLQNNVNISNYKNIIAINTLK